MNSAINVKPPYKASTSHRVSLTLYSGLVFRLGGGGGGIAPPPPKPPGSYASGHIIIGKEMGCEMWIDIGGSYNTLN